MSQALLSAVTPAGAAIATQEAILHARDAVLRGETLSLPTPRVLLGEEYTQFKADLGALRGRLVAEHLAKARRHATPAARVLAIVKSAAIFIRRGGLDQPEVLARMERQIQELTDSPLPLALVLPIGGGKVANPVKTGNRFLPDATEWMAHVHLAAMAEAIGEVHPPGAVIVTVPDAPLHTADVGFSWPEVHAHVRKLRGDLGELGIGGLVTVADTVALLPAEWPAFVRERARDLAERAKTDEFLARGQRDRSDSLQFSVATEANGWSYERSVLVASGVAGHARGLSTDVMADALELRRRTEQVVATYDAVNLAIRELRLAERAAEAAIGRPEHLRLTVHAKPLEPRPQLAWNGPRSRPALIPMHASALRYSHDGSWRLAAVFDVEARVQGYRPVLHPDGGRFLFFELVESPPAALQAG